MMFEEKIETKKKYIFHMPYKALCLDISCSYTTVMSENAYLNVVHLVFISLKLQINKFS